eukprot:scaffold168239_cov18-Tisochrysis_lutea.AAC.1
MDAAGWIMACNPGVRFYCMFLAGAQGLREGNFELLSSHLEQGYILKASPFQKESVHSQQTCRTSHCEQLTWVLAWHAGWALPAHLQGYLQET